MLAPKLRFKEFNDEWNYKLFNEIFEFIQNNSFSRDMLNYSENSKIYNIHYGDILTKYGEIIDFNIISNIIPKINNDLSLSKFEDKSYLKNGDIIIADTAEDLTVGKSCEVVNLHCKALAGLHTIPCRPKFKFASQYLGEYINSTSYHSQLIPYITGIKVSSISKTSIIKTKIYFPTVKEQEKISELFSLLNKKIELQQRKIEVLKMYKKGLERKVFNTLSKSTNNKIITEIADTFIGLVTTMTEHYVENGVRLIRNSDIKENQFIFNDDIFLDENFANKNCNRKHIIGDIVTVHTGDVGTSSIIDEKLALTKNYIFMCSPKFRTQTNRLKRVIMQSIEFIIEEMKMSDFEIIGNEVEFKNGAKYEPIRIKSDSGKDIEIIGKIDRIDLAKNVEGQYVRIIDYKSSIKDINLNEVVAGLQIQLLTYLDATCKVEDMLPAGVLYFNLIDATVKAKKPMSEEEIKEELKKQFKMKGLILADVNVVKMMDKTLEKGWSKTIPAYIDKEGNLSKSMSNAVSKEQFEKLQKYTKKIIKDISNEILSGNIELKPYYKVKDKKTPCEYCDYKSICQFNKGFCGNDYNYIYNLDKNVVLDKLK